MKRHIWKGWEVEFLKKNYADSLTADIATVLGIPAKRVLAKAHALGLHKTKELIAQTARARTQKPAHGSRATQFAKGLRPWNTGLKGVTGTQAACRATQFKPGARPATWVPVGSFRVVEGDILEQKFADEAGPPGRRWKAYARIVWEQANGPVPEGHAVVFRPGKKTTDPALVTLDAIELVSRADLVRRNSIHRYPDELRSVMRLRGQINRAIKQAEEATT